MRKLAIAAMVSGALLVQASGASADALRVAQASSGTSEKSGAAAEKMPGKGAVSSVKVRGTIDAIDKDKGTITLKGPKGRTVTSMSGTGRSSTPSRSVIPSLLPTWKPW